MTDNQGFSLTHSITTASSPEVFDVRLLKIALNRLGYYTPDKDIGLADFTDANMFAALKDFQKDKRLTATGAIRPGDATEAAIDRAIEDQPLSAKYIWRTCGDDKVRSGHAAREGKTFSWINPPEGGNPGQDHNCRCWAEPVKKGYTEKELHTPGIDAIKPEYPIEIMAGFIAGGQLALALRKLNEAPRNLNFQWSSYKSVVKWANQRKIRGWEDDNDVIAALKHGKRYQVFNKRYPEHPTIMYVYKGKFLVRDEKLNYIIQVGGKGFKLPEIIGKGP